MDSLIEKAKATIIARAAREEPRGVYAHRDCKLATTQLLTVEPFQPEARTF